MPVVTIGQHIRDARLAASLSVLELSNKSGISDATIYRIEQGLHPRPRMATLRALAAALDMDPADLTTRAVA